MDMSLDVLVRSRRQDQRVLSARPKERLVGCALTNSSAQGAALKKGQAFGKAGSERLRVRSFFVANLVSNCLGYLLAGFPSWVCLA